MSISHWPSWQRPREKLLLQGAKSLSDNELLALFIGSGIRGKSALEIANSLLREFGDFNGLFSASDKALQRMPGVGLAKFSLLKASLELAKRYLAERVKCLPNLDGMKDARAFLGLQLQHRKREVIACLYLNSQLQAVEYKEVFVGTINKVMVHPREIAKQALDYYASYVILAHNHPSGRVEPSEADIELTKALSRLLNLLDIQLLDHLIIARGQSYSFKQFGRL
jgi:DNA repair protein RadC